MKREQETFSELCAEVSSGQRGSLKWFEQEVVPLVEIVLRRSGQAKRGAESLDASLAASRRQAERICRALITRLSASRSCAETIGVRLAARLTRLV